MAVPKRKWSKARSRRARSNWKISAPNLVECPQCKSLAAAHRVCKNCGYYKGREVISVDDK
ncbi:MAG: 50S ribosomal protein L32 [Clostridiaceae bacterium]|nr:50S ribosomal protein L32 [Clostridiaceae bacterium]HZW97259.1 50S ribosomal protein L32 [Bacillota bacterium]